MRLKDEHKLAIGASTMVLGIFFSRLESVTSSGVPVFSFLSGMFIGLSLVMNLAYLVSRRRNVSAHQQFNSAQAS